MAIDRLEWYKAAEEVRGGGRYSGRGRSCLAEYIALSSASRVVVGVKMSGGDRNAEAMLVIRLGLVGARFFGILGWMLQMKRPRCLC